MHTHVGQHHMFQYNGDCSGDVTIIRFYPKLETILCTIPFAELVDLVAQVYILPRRIEQLEDMDANAIPGLLTNS